MGSKVRVYVDFSLGGLEQWGAKHQDVVVIGWGISIYTWLELFPALNFTWTLFSKY